MSSPAGRLQGVRPTLRRPVNVLQLTTGLGIGGAEMVVRDLVKSLDRSRFTASICCLKVLGPIGEELASEGVDVSVLPGVDPHRANYFSSLKLAQLMQEKRIDVVHSHTTYALGDAGLCRLTRRDLRSVHTFHFGNYPHLGRRLYWMERVFLRLADRLVAVGEVQKEQIQHAYGLSDSAIQVVRNGVPIPSGEGGDLQFRTRIGAAGKVLIGTIATLIPQKGLPDLMAAARLVRDAMPNVHFVIVGEGEMRPELERLQRDLDLAGTVTLTGWVTNAAARALPSFDIYFQPSRWEAMSISILEAMAAGKPVVSTRVGEAVHVISDSEGLLYEPGDVAGMAQGLIRIAADESRRREMGAAAARKVADRHTLRHMTRAYEAIYMDLVQRRDADRT